MTTAAVKSAPRAATRSWTMALGVAISVVCLWLATRRVQWGLILAHISHVRSIPFLAGVIAAPAVYAMMAYRWRTLLADTCPLSIGDAFDFTMIGYLAGLIMPQRLGDVAKAALLGRRAGVSRTMIFGTVVLERLSDVLMLLVLAAFFALTTDLPVLLSLGLWMLAAVTALLAFGLWLGPSRWDRMLSPLLRRLPARAARTVASTVAKFALGVEAIRDPQRFGKPLMLTVLLWTVSGLGMSAYVAAFGLNVPWYAGFLVILLTNLGGILPASPGALGVYHYMAVLALTVWTADRTAALSFAIVTHAMSLLLTALAGGWSLARQGLSLRALRAGSSTIA